MSPRRLLRREQPRNVLSRHLMPNRRLSLAPNLAQNPLHENPKQKNLDNDSPKELNQLNPNCCETHGFPWVSPCLGHLKCLELITYVLEKAAFLAKRQLLDGGRVLTCVDWSATATLGSLKEISGGVLYASTSLGTLAVAGAACLSRS